MTLETFINGRFTKIDDQKCPSNFKHLLGFLSCNSGYDCFSKFQGKVWKITRNGKWVEVCRNIPDLTYAEYLKISKL